MYQLIVLKTEKNENFEDEKKQFEDVHRFGYRPDHTYPMPPTLEVVKDVLKVHLDEEQFQAVKKAVIETFK